MPLLNKPPAKAAQLKHRIMLVFKLAFVLGALWLVFYQINLNELLSHLTNISLLSLAAGYVLLTLAQVVSAMRSRYYFRKDGLKLSVIFSNALYFVGMFYNNILPGGIGGDGYKLYLIGKLTSFSRIRALQLFVSERANGLLIVILLSILLLPFSQINDFIPHSFAILLLGTIVIITGYFASIHLILKEKPFTAIGALPYSLVIQLLNVLIICLILSDLGTKNSPFSEIFNYVVIFLIASVLAILPISIGGIGIREVAFVYSAKWFNIDAEIGVSLALLYYTITLATSFNGLIFINKLERLYNRDKADGSTTNTTS